MAELIELLLAARRTKSPIEHVPAELIPDDLAAAYKIAEKIFESNGDELAGWKVGATSAMAQSMLNVPEPFYGRIAGSKIVASPATVELDSRRVALEAEIAVKIGPANSGGRPLDQGGIVVCGLAPAIEVNRPSANDALQLGIRFVTADNGVNDGLVLGEGVDLAGLDDLSDVAVSVQVNGAEVAAGSGAAVLGDPLNAVRWLVAELKKSGQQIDGEYVISTGAMTAPFDAAAGDQVVADYGSFGRVEVNLR